jgi:hypothetical protein
LPDARRKNSGRLPSPARLRLVAAGGAWQYLFTADVGRFTRLDDPAVRAQYPYGFGIRVDGGTFTAERFAVRRL